MKKTFRILCLALALSCLLCGAALADFAVGDDLIVTGCKEFVSLRYDPLNTSEVMARLGFNERVVYLDSEGDYAYVGTPYGKGYVLSKYLKPVSNYDSARAVSLTRAERYNVNLFLSNFTETGIGWENGYFTLADNAEMVEFALEHIWFNQQSKLEWVDDGEDNVRVRIDLIPGVCEKYFGVAPLSPMPKWCNMSAEYYSWQETGGHVSNGFAMQTSVLSLGGGYYLVYFERLGGGEMWDNDVLYLSLDEARAMFPYGQSSGSAIIYAGDLANRATFRLVRYAIR